MSSHDIISFIVAVILNCGLVGLVFLFNLDFFVIL